MSIDPVTFMDTGEPVHFNRYAYANNDPVNLVDLFGLCATDASGNKTGFCPAPGDKGAESMINQQMKDPNSSLPQAEADAVKSGTYVSVSSGTDFAGKSSAGPLTDAKGNILPNEHGMSFAKEMGVVEDSKGNITSSPSSATEVFEHEVGHVMDAMAGKPLTDTTVDSSGYRDSPNEVSAMNRTNAYRRKSGMSTQRFCHGCSVAQAQAHKKRTTP